MIITFSFSLPSEAEPHCFSIVACTMRQSSVRASDHPNDRKKPHQSPEPQPPDCLLLHVSQRNMQLLLATHSPPEPTLAQTHPCLDEAPFAAGLPASWCRWYSDRSPDLPPLKPLDAGTKLLGSLG